MSTVRVGLIAFAALNLVLALAMVLTPHLFFTDIGPYGSQNNHYLRDLATFYAAFGVAMAIAYSRPAWRAPILWCAALQSGLHAINHLVDIDNAHPRWLGPANFISLTLATCALVWLARESMRPVEVQR
jgi:hypothetical protein